MHLSIHDELANLLKHGKPKRLKVHLNWWNRFALATHLPV
jgi:hypothetical protein